MKRSAAFFAIIVISFGAANPLFSAPGRPGIGDRLSLSLTNKYGDVLENPSVAQILSDGLVLQRGTMAMKVKYEDLPPAIRKKYQSLATEVIKKEEQAGAANAAYFAYTERLQAEQAQHLTVQEQRENKQAVERMNSQSTAAPRYLAIPIPNQNWKLIIANMKFSKWQKQENNGQFVLHGLPGPSGFNLVLFVEEPENSLPGNDPVYHYYWSHLAHASLIDAQTVRVERKDKFIKVSYIAQDRPNVNYFFAYRGKWVDVHIWKWPLVPGDKKLFDEFDHDLSYGQ